MDRLRRMYDGTAAMGGSAPAMLTLTATTTGAGQTVTLNQITPTGGACTVDWGDTQTSTIADGNTGTTTHTYAAAGAYPIKISNPNLITAVDLSDAKLGGFNTAQLRNNVLTYFRVTAITGSTIDTADMAAWRPGYWNCYSMPTGGTYNIDTADMAAWRPGYWYCYSMPTGGTYNIDTADMAAWRPSYWYCYSMPAGWHIQHRQRRHGGVAAWLLELLLDADRWHVQHRHGRHGGVAA